jgi:hypothetical protein
VKQSLPLKDRQPVLGLRNIVVRWFDSSGLSKRPFSNCSTFLLLCFGSCMEDWEERKTAIGQQIRIR